MTPEGVKGEEGGGHVKSGHKGLVAFEKSQLWHRAAAAKESWAIAVADTSHGLLSSLHRGTSHCCR